MTPDLHEHGYCLRCAAPLEIRTRGGSPRPVCAACGFVLYRNPTTGVAVIVLQKGAVLLGRRRWGSTAGHWCIPCGHVEWGEDIRDAAVREFEEETGLRVRLGPVYNVHSNFHNPAHYTVGVWFAAASVEGELLAGDDLDEVAYFPLDALPEPLAFPTDRLILDQLRAEAGLILPSPFRSNGTLPSPLPHPRRAVLRRPPDPAGDNAHL